MTVATFSVPVPPNKGFHTDKVAVPHLLQKAQKLRHKNFAAEQQR
jgi:hypothetical protein